MAIDPIGTGLTSTLGSERAQSGGETFSRAVTDLLKEINRDQVDAARSVKEFAIDGKGSIHEAMAAMNKAEGSLRLLMEMRNRLVDGINRLLQTQV